MMGRHERGTALIAVSWLLLLLTVLVAGALGVTRSELGTVEHVVRRSQANAAADGAIVQIIAQLTLGDGAQDRPAEHDAVRVGEFEVAVTIQDEAGNVDINRAPEDLLVRVLANWTDSSTEAERLAARIVDWRDPDNVKSPNGAEALDYRADGRSYSPRNGPLPAVSELKQLLGMAPDLFACVAPMLTVHSGLAGVDSGAMGPELRAVLDGEEGPVGIDPEVEPSGVDLVGRVVRLRAEVLRDDVHVVREAVVRLTGDTQRPALVMSWGDTVQQLETCAIVITRRPAARKGRRQRACQ